MLVTMKCLEGKSQYLLRDVYEVTTCRYVFFGRFYASKSAKKLVLEFPSCPTEIYID